MLFGRYRVVVHVAPSRKQEFPIGVITPTPSIVAIQRSHVTLKAYIYCLENDTHKTIVCVLHRNTKYKIHSKIFSNTAYLDLCR